MEDVRYKITHEVEYNPDYFNWFRRVLKINYSLDKVEELLMVLITTGKINVLINSNNIRTVYYNDKETRISSDIWHMNILKFFYKDFISKD